MFAAFARILILIIMHGCSQKRRLSSRESIATQVKPPSIISAVMWDRFRGATRSWAEDSQYWDERRDRLQAIADWNHKRIKLLDSICLDSFMGSSPRRYKISSSSQFFEMKDCHTCNVIDNAPPDFPRALYLTWSWYPRIACKLSISGESNATRRGSMEILNFSIYDRYQNHRWKRSSSTTSRWALSRETLDRVRFASIKWNLLELSEEVDDNIASFTLSVEVKVHFPFSDLK